MQTNKIDKNAGFTRYVNLFARAFWEKAKERKIEHWLLSEKQINAQQHATDIHASSTRQTSQDMSPQQDTQ